MLCAPLLMSQNVSILGSVIHFFPLEYFNVDYFISMQNVPQAVYY